MNKNIEIKSSPCKSKSSPQKKDFSKSTPAKNKGQTKVAVEKQTKLHHTYAACVGGSTSKKERQSNHESKHKGEELNQKSESNIVV